MGIYDTIMLNLNRFVNKKNLTLGGLANKIGVNKQNFYAYRDRRANIPIETLELISKRFEVPMTYWFEEKEDHHTVKEGSINYEPSKQNEMNQLIKDLEYFRERCKKLERELEELKGNINPIRKAR